MISSIQSSTASNEYKLILVGPGGSGKTAFLKKIRLDVFEKRHISTLGVEVYPIRWGNTSYSVWDCGSGKYKGLGTGNYMNANVAIIVVDVTTEKKLLKKEISRYRREIRDTCGNIPILVLLNKYDLLKKDGGYHYVSEEDDNLRVYACSVKDGIGVRESFDWLVSK